MAEVFRAESAGIEGFKKKVAIKRVLPHLSQKRKFISMFLDEARLSAHLTHSNVVQVFDIGVGDNTYFIVMEYVDGADLKAIIETRRKRQEDFPLEAAVYIATRMCEGLAYAHNLTDSEGRPFGIVHRDMSPPNVLITRYGEVKIADFGLAKANNQLEKSEPGIIKGKFSYLAPEAAVGHDVDARVDIFAVGVILWEMLAGRRLFIGESDYETVKLVQQANVPKLSEINRRVPPALDRILEKTLARDLNQRYAHAVDLARDLNSFLHQHGQPVGPWDIAQLVAEADDQKRREKPASANIIDQLIKQALFEFTSLRGDDQESLNTPGRTTPTRSPLPLELGSGGVRDWESEILIKNPYGPGKGAASNDRLLSSLADLQLGNLSALEDLPPGTSDPPHRAQRAARRDPPQSLRNAAAGARPSEHPSPSGATLQAAASESVKKKSTLALILFIVLLLGAASAAGAWYARIAPH